MAWPVVLTNDNGIRPAGKPDECFYCNSKVGQPHGYECVMVSKKVKVAVEYEVEVPFFWDAERIEFHRNESSWCSDNLLTELEALKPKGEGEEDEGGCLCGQVRVRYVATTNPGPLVRAKEEEL